MSLDSSKYTIKGEVLIALVFIVLTGLSLFFINEKFNITGLIVGLDEEKTLDYSDSLNLRFDFPSNYDWTPQNNCNYDDCSINYIKISGYIGAGKSGEVRIYLEGSGNNYLIYENEIKLNEVVSLENITKQEEVSRIDENTNETIVELVDVVEETSTTTEQPETFNFDGVCEETCDFKLDLQNNYKLIFDVEENLSININEIEYGYIFKEKSEVLEEEPIIEQTQINDTAVLELPINVTTLSGSPFVKEFIPNQTLVLNTATQIYLSNYFSDPENENLQFGFSTLNVSDITTLSGDIDVVLNGNIATIITKNKTAVEKIIFYASDSSNRISSNEVEIIASEIEPVIETSREIFGLNENPEFVFVYIPDEEFNEIVQIKEEIKDVEFIAESPITGMIVSDLGFGSSEAQSETQEGGWIDENDNITIYSYYNENPVDLEVEVGEIRDGKFNLKFGGQKSGKAGAYKIRLELNKDNKTYVAEKEFLWGLISLNTKKSIYRPDETAEFEIVVLNKWGFAVSDAPIDLTIINDNNKAVLSTKNGNIKETNDTGVYEANYKVNSEGNYTVYVQTIVDGMNLNFSTYFLVKQDYDFDIIRTAKSKIDPTKEENFNVNINIESLNGADEIILREFIPIEFNIIDDGGANVEIDESSGIKILRWNKKLNDNKASINYVYDVPDVWPYLYSLGELEIAHNNQIFNEARPWYVAVDPFVPSGKGLFVYANTSTPGRPYQRNWTGSALNGDQLIATDYGASLAWMRYESVKGRDEGILLASEVTDLDLNFEIYRPKKNAWDNATSLTLVLSNVLTQNFDVACEGLSGECIVVYDNSSSNREAYYKIWSATGLGAEQTISSICAVNGFADWISLYPKNNSDDIMMAFADNNTDLCMALWNGTSNSFQGITTITQVLAAADRKSFDFAWEGSSGDGLLVYGNTTAGVWGYNYTAATDTWVNNKSILWTLGESSTIHMVELCGSNTENRGLNHDYIGIIVQGSGDHVDARIWDGVKIQTSPAPPGTDIATEGTMPPVHIDCAWETSSKTQAIFVWVDLGSLTPESTNYT